MLRTKASFLAHSARLQTRRGEGLIISHPSLCRRRWFTTSKEANTSQTQWPGSLHEFVTGIQPIVTRPLPYIGRVTIDFGTCMLNFGAITSLSGFCMTDVLYLRTLSIIGSFSGIIYNLTRVPKQMNAVAWGFVFAGVNTVQIVRLLLERKEIKFTVQEAELYYKSFAPFGVEASTFQLLMKDLGQWKSYEPGKILIEEGKPLENVIILVQGKATAYSDKQNKPLYSYSSDDNGKIVGATGLVDPSILGRAYPNRVVADEPTKVLALNTEKLQSFLKAQNANMEAALFHMMYVDLIGTLRRHRASSQGTLAQKTEGIGMALHDLRLMLQQACADGIVHPTERRLIRQHMEKHGLDQEQLFALLAHEDIGWSREEWKDGAKLKES